MKVSSNTSIHNASHRGKTQEKKDNFYIYAVLHFITIDRDGI